MGVDSMKTPEDEAFDDIERRQGGFQAKRQMAADKLQEPVVQPAPGYCKNCKDYTIEEPLYAQPAQEPVALVIDGVLVKSALPEKYTGHLYTTPPQRPWVGLTDEERSKIWGGIIKYAPSEMRIKDLAQAIEAKLKEKNG